MYKLIIPNGITTQTYEGEAEGTFIQLLRRLRNTHLLDTHIVYEIEDGRQLRVNIQNPIENKTYMMIKVL